MHVNKKKDILILDKALTQRLDDTRLTAELQCSINFTKFVKLSYVYTIMEVTVFICQWSKISKSFWINCIPNMFGKYFKRFFKW